MFINAEVRHRFKDPAAISDDPPPEGGSRGTIFNLHLQRQRRVNTRGRMSKVCGRMLRDEEKGKRRIDKHTTVDRRAIRTVGDLFVADADKEISFLQFQTDF